MTTYPYLGTPGAMLQLPGPNGDLDAPTTRGESVATVLGGGTAVLRRLAVKHSYVLPYTARPGVGLDDLLAGLYAGALGAGPFVFVDPSVRNVLGMDVATCGARPEASPGWASTSGALSVDPALAGPVALAAALKCAGPSGAATLAPTLALGAAPVYLPGEAVTASIYLRASAAGTYSLTLVGYDAAGAVVSATTTATGAVTTTGWTRLTVSAAAGAAAFTSSALVLPRVSVPASAPATVWLSAAQLEYGPLTAWQPGNGSPRVVVTGSPGRTVQHYGWSTHTLNLAEV